MGNKLSDNATTKRKPNGTPCAQDESPTAAWQSEEEQYAVFHPESHEEKKEGENGMKITQYCFDKHRIFPYHRLGRQMRSVIAKLNITTYSTSHIPSEVLCVQNRWGNFGKSTELNRTPVHYIVASDGLVPVVQLHVVCGNGNLLKKGVL